MQTEPDRLDIPRGDPRAAIWAFIKQSASQLWLCFFAAFQVFRHASEGPSWVDGLLVFAGILVALSLVSQVRAFIANLKSDTPYVTMDRSGLACSLPTRKSWRWADLAACACKNDNGRTVLRLFLRGLAERTVDIDFALAAQPKHALDEAMVACAAWIVAARDPAITESPLREFIDRRPARGPLLFWRDKSLMIFTCVALALAVLLVVVVAAFNRQVREEPPMPVDGRPEQKVLFLGNSRIAVNDLPRMVRDVADSGHSPIRYDIHMRAWSGATLKGHWYDHGDRAALREPWDLVILQPQSGAFMGDWAAQDTASYGERLIRAAEAGGSRVAVMANWALGPSSFSGDATEAAAAAKAYADTTERLTRALAGRAGAGVIDLDGAFAEAEATVPGVEMTFDGNHPSHAGTFLAALVIYGYLSHADLSGIDWRPYDMSKATAATLKSIAARHLL